MISIVAKFKVTPGKEDAFLKTIKPLVEASRLEPGCVSYNLRKHKTEELVYVMIEEWKDEEAVELHNNSSHFTSIIPEVVKLSEVEVDLYTPAF